LIQVSCIVLIIVIIVSLRHTHGAIVVCHGLDRVLEHLTSCAVGTFGHGHKFGRENRGAGAGRLAPNLSYLRFYFHPES
jgi:hypothetical protein